MDKSALTIMAVIAGLVTVSLLKKKQVVKTPGWSIGDLEVT